MRGLSAAAALAVTAVLAAGCGASRHITIPPDLPPSPASWPPYPTFTSASCWARPSIGGGVQRAAPSYLATPSHQAPALIARAVLAGLGDRRYVRRIELGPPPPVTRQHQGWFGKSRPPANALWAYIAAPVAAEGPPAHPGPEFASASGIAQWEVELVQGALRDAFCAAGGRPLVGWTARGVDSGVSDGGNALGQRFPSPDAAVFSQRVAAIGRRYGFRVVSLRLLHASQTAPLLIVETNRKRRAFVADIPAIMALVDPVRSAAHGTALTFEGFFFEARDGDGPFTFVENIYRGVVEGGEWAADPCDAPFPHSQPFTTTNPCP